MSWPVYSVVRMPAVPAKHRREQNLVPVAGNVLLPAERDDPFVFGFQRSPHRVTASDELVKPKRKKHG